MATLSHKHVLFGHFFKKTTSLLLTLALLVTLLPPISIVEAATTLKSWDFLNSAESWVTASTTKAITWYNGDIWTAGIVYADCTGNDPEFISPSINISANNRQKVVVRIATHYGSSHEMRVYWKRSSDASFLETKSRAVTYSSTTQNNFQTVEVDVGNSSEWYGTISQIRIDPSNSTCSTPAFRFHIDSVQIQENDPLTGSISGGTRDAATGIALSNVAARLESNGGGSTLYGPVYSDANGVYQINDIAPGTYRLTGLKTGYDNWFQDNTVITSGQNKTGQNIAMNQSLPALNSFSINNGASETTSRTVTLNNSASGVVKQYMASENSSFSGASWQAYSTALSFTLSSGYGNKTVYFKVKNDRGESGTLSDTITYAPTPKITEDRTTMKVGETINLTCDLSTEGTSRSVAFFTSPSSGALETYPATTNSSGIATKPIQAKSNWVPTTSFACRDEATLKASGYDVSVSVTAASVAPNPPTNVAVKYDDQHSPIWNYVTWTAAASAAKYKVYWRNSPGVTKTNSNTDETTATQYGHTGVDGPACYYYAISTVGTNGLESGLSSEVFVCLPELTLSTSSAKVGDDITFTCDMGTNGANTRVDFLVNNQSGARVADSGTTVINTDANGKAVWHAVTAASWKPKSSAVCRDYAKGTPSNPWKDITVGDTAVKPTLLLPASGASVTDRKIKFDWSDVPGATKYVLLVDNNSGFGSPEIYQEITGASEYEVSDWLWDNTYSWKVIAYFADGTSQVSDPWLFTYHIPVPPLTPPTWVPLFRLYNSTLKDHYYTTIVEHRADWVLNKGYTYERIEGYISALKFDGGNCVPLFRLYSSSQNAGYFTSSEAKKDELIAGGYTYNGIVGFMYGNNNTASDIVPFYHVEKASITDNFYTISKFESDNAVASFGFLNRGTEGYLRYISPTSLEQPTVHTQPQANFGGIDLASGAYRGLNSLDLAVKGRGPSLSFAHYYNSSNLNDLPMGRGWSHSLNSEIIEDPNDGTEGVVFVFWGNGSVSKFAKSGTTYIDKTGNYDELTKTTNGYSLKRKDQTVYTYDKKNKCTADSGGTHDARIVLTSIQDWIGNTLTLSYEAPTAACSNVNLLAARDQFNRELRFTYDSTGKLKKVEELADGSVRRYIMFDYNARGLLQAYTDPRSKITRFEYYEENTESFRNNLLKDVIYPRQNKVLVDYAPASGYAKAKSVSQIDSTGTKTLAIIYPEAGKDVTTITTPSGNVFEARHDSLGRMLSLKQSSDLKALEITRNADNTPSVVTDPKGNVTKYDYVARGNVSKITNAKSKIATFTYNDQNNVLTSTDFHDATDVTVVPTTYIYEDSGRKLRFVTNPENEVTELRYDTNSLVKQLVDGRGMITSFGYDTYGNPSSITDAEGHTTQYGLDYAGRTTSTIDANGLKTFFDFDNSGNLTQTRYMADAQRSFAELFRVNTPPDDNDNLDSVSWTNNGQSATTKYGYDEFDRLASVTNPLNLSYTFLYNPDNQLKQRTAPTGDITKYDYDNHGRLQQVNYPDGSNVVVNTRDPNSNIQKITSKSGSTQFEYNELNQLTKYTDPNGKTIMYAYDAAGRLQTLTYPAPSYKMVNYTYDKAGRLKTVSGDWIGTTTYIYDTAGNLKEIWRSNGTKAIYTYDRAGRLTDVSERKSDGSEIAGFLYTLDPVGNQTAAHTRAEPLSTTRSAAETTYTYDTANRLKTAGAVSYTYDNNGNRKTQTGSGQTTSFAWDFENVLQKVTRPDNSTVEYKYDALGNRISRTDSSGAKKQYIVAPAGPLSPVLAETDSAGNITAYYIHGLGLLSRVDTATGQQLFYHYNHRGDTLALTDASQNITDKYTYDEYGKLLSRTGTTDNPFRFMGRFGVMDEGNDLYFMHARYYDANVGRFISPDPLDFGGGDWNLYAYAGNNPMSQIDPSGLSVSTRNKYMDTALGVGMGLGLSVASLAVATVLVGGAVLAAPVVAAGAISAGVYVGATMTAAAPIILMEIGLHPEATTEIAMSAFENSLKLADIDSGTPPEMKNPLAFAIDLAFSAPDIVAGVGVFASDLSNSMDPRNFVYGETFNSTPIWSSPPLKKTPNRQFYISSPKPAFYWNQGGSHGASGSW